MLDGPYLGLLPYHEEDARFFFGRDMERRIISANLITAPLTILYGPSGAGKSSLLRAGVAHQLRQRAIRDRESGRPQVLIPFVFSAWRDDLTQGLYMAAVDALKSAGYEGQSIANDVSDLTHKLTQLSKFHMIRFLVILDQFEEFFLYADWTTGHGALIEDLASLAADPSSPANVLISIREDALAKLDLFQEFIPNLFRNYLRLNHLDLSSARVAIERPIDEYNMLLPPDRPQFQVEPELVAAVIEQLRGGRVSLASDAPQDTFAEPESDLVEAPYLQIVMLRVWNEEVACGSRCLRRETLHSLGEASSIIRNHLEQALSALNERDQDIAALAFHHLVTPTGSKIALSTADLSAYSGVSESDLSPVLDMLASQEARVLRLVPPPLDQPELVRYEIFHDVLGPAIQERWRRYAEKQAELLAQREAEQRRWAALEEQSKRRTRTRGRLVATSAFALSAILVIVLAYGVTQGWHIVGMWEDLHGPPGGDVRPLLIEPEDPQTVYTQVLGQDGGVYRSGDHGISWAVTGNGLTRTEVSELVVDPADSRRFYLSTIGTGIFRSDDRGANWSVINTGLNNYSVTDLYAHPTRPNLIYAAASGANGGIYISTNGGDRWQWLTGRGFESLHAYKIVPDPDNPDLFYVITDYNVYRTRDAGNSFELADYDMLPAVTSLLILPGEPKLFFAAAQGGRLWKKEGEAGEWTRVDLDNPLDVTLAVYGEAANSNVLFLSVLKQHDGYGFWRSDDRGVTWHNDAQGLTKARVREVISSRNPLAPVYLSAAGVGLFQSVDHGKTWRTVESGRGRFVCRLLTVNPSRPAELWASDAGALMQSRNGGATWEFKMSGLPSGWVRAILFDPTNPDVLLVGLYRPGIVETIFRSNDGGETWGASADGVQNDDVTSLVSIGSPPVYFAGSSGSGIYRSADGGVWATANRGLARLDIADLLAIENTNSLVIAATAAGIYRTSDLGANWQPASEGLTDLNVRVLAANTSSGLIYAGTRDSGVFVTRNYGGHWLASNNGLTRLKIIDIVVDPQNSDIAYLATDSGGGFVTRDGGYHWASISRGAASNLISALAMPVSGHPYLYVASWDQGVFRYSTQYIWQRLIAPFP